MPTLTGGSPSSTRTGASGVARRGDVGEQDVLERYFRDLDAERLMGPDEELQAARCILELRREYWVRLLSYSPFAVAVLDAIEGQCEQRGKKAPLKPMRKVFGAGPEPATSRSRKNAERAIAAFAETMADLDPGSDIIDSIVADIEALASGSARGVQLGVRTPRRDSAPFASYVQGLLRARMALQSARRSFARANLRLVVTMAQRYRRNGRMSFADLIQEGNVGLMTAVDRFDPRRGFRFSTYGSWWIRHAISRALSDKGRAVRLPVHVIELQSKLSRVRRDFEHKEGREPDDLELAQEAGVPLEKVERFGRVLLEQDSPSAPDGIDGARVPGIEAVADETPDADAQLDNRMLDGSLQEALEILRPMEADILRMRFGLSDDPPMTLREIGGIYSLSRERIRQIQERALAKLREALERDGFCETPDEVLAAIDYVD